MIAALPEARIDDATLALPGLNELHQVLQEHRKWCSKQQP
jgi:hypothetical protein